jgi:hypothetical protein
MFHNIYGSCTSEAYPPTVPFLAILIWLNGPFGPHLMIGEQKTGQSNYRKCLVKDKNGKVRKGVKLDIKEKG